MQLPISSKWTPLFVSIVGIILPVVVVFAMVLKPASRTGEQALIDPFNGWSIQYLPSKQAVLGSIVALPPLHPGLPARLEIPAINVSSTVEYVGLTAEGAMDITKRLDHVAWYRLGARPGENGTAVIAGHYGLKNARAVFDDLKELRPGDLVYVEDDQGERITFVVNETRTFDPDADATAVFESNDGMAHLNIITCDGVWDDASQSYSRRLVVFTDRAE